MIGVYGADCVEDGRRIWTARGGNVAGIFCFLTEAIKSIVILDITFFNNFFRKVCRT